MLNILKQLRQRFAAQPLAESARWQPKWKLTKYANEQAKLDGIADETMDVEGNCLLDEGIIELWKLLIGDLSATAYNSVTTRLGVGDGNTPATNVQTGLQGGTKTFKAVDAGYPKIVGTTLVLRASFGANDANHPWMEVTAANGANDSAKNLNRKVQEFGLKVNPAVWVLELTLSLV